MLPKNALLAFLNLICVLRHSFSNLCPHTLVFQSDTDAYLLSSNMLFFDTGFSSFFNPLKAVRIAVGMTKALQIKCKTCL